MTNQYLKMISRDLLKRKSFSLINIAGIALGFVVCILTLLFVYTEFSFDRYIPGVENKYRLVWGSPDDINAILPYVFKEKMESRLPEGSEVCLRCSIGSQFLSLDQKDYKIENIVFSDSQFLSMFGTSLIQGDPADILDAPMQIMISESAKRKMFGDQNPVGRMIRFGSEDYTITGVFRDLPGNSHLCANVVVSTLSWKNLAGNNLNSWGYKAYDYYFSFPSNTDIIRIQEQLKSLYLASDPGYISYTPAQKSNISFTLEPMTDIHLKSAHVLWDDDKNKGNMNIVIAFIFIGMLILLMAAFNYINLSTAFFQTKNKLSGIQKVLGASTKNLSCYIFLQTALMVAGGLLLSLVLVNIILPFFRLIVERDIPFSLLYSPFISGAILLIALIMIVFSGLYPAVCFSRENPILAIKSKMPQSDSLFGLSLRKTLVISQFAISMMLVSGILIMGRQIKMMSHENLGFSSGQLIDIRSGFNKEQYELFKDQLKTIPGVAAVSAASNTPAQYIDNENPFRLSRETDEQYRDGSSIVGIEPDYFEVMGIRLLEGEAFTSDMEDRDGAIINRAAVESLGIENAIGEKIHHSMTGKDYTIIGIVEDVQYRSLREKPGPVIYLSGYNSHQKTVIRLRAGNLTETLQEIKKVWRTIYPETPFDFNFFDTKLQSNYAYETSMMRLLNMLVVISLMISSLGIFGLIMEISIQRTKEIGIRKVSGARISEIMFMLNQDFVKWIAVAFVLATPVAYFAMTKWLENYALKTSLSWWIFALSGALALGIALLTVSWQSWKAATRNPVEALRYE